MYVLLFALTILVVQRLAATIDCPRVDRHSSIVINCFKHGLTDDDYVSTFASLPGDDDADDEQSGGNATEKNGDMIMLLESNEIQTLKILPGIRRIVELSFRRNRVASAQNGAFQNLRRLKILDLGHNELTGSKLTADVFRGVTVGRSYMSMPLEELNLESNKIRSLNRDVFKYLPNLKSLTLNNNPIYSIDLDFEKAFLHLTKLRVLSIAQTTVSDLPETMFKVNPIETLYLNGNHLSLVPNAVRNVARYLQYLNLNGNPLREINASSFSQLSNLMELQLSSSNTLKKIGANAFSPLINLRVLVCSFNSKLNMVDARAFAHLQTKSNLKEVFLNDNNLRNISEQTLDWEKLSVLRLDGNPWDCTCSLQWLFDFIQTREKLDPEANLGIRCKYPAELKESTFIRASLSLQCADRTASDHDAVVPIGFLKTTTFILCIFIMFGLCLLYYYLYKRIRRARRLQTRYSGTAVKSITKYRRAQLNDASET